MQEPKVVYPVGIGARHQYGSGGIPHAKLIGVDGTVVWEGHPARLTDDIIEAELRKVRRYSDVEGRRAQRAGKDLDKGKYGKALAEAQKILENESVDDVDRKSAQEIVDAVNATGERKLAYADALAADGEVDRAKDLLKDVEDAFSRTPFEDRAKEKRKALEDDDALAELAEARKTVEQYLARTKLPIKGDDREMIRRALEKKQEDFEGQAAKDYVANWLTLLSEDWVPKR